MAEGLFESIAGHLPYLGYRMKMEEGILKTVEAPVGQPYFWVWPVNQGATFRTIYKAGPNAEIDSVGFLRFVNQANSVSVVSRFLEYSPGYLSVEAWYPPCYSRESFAIFLTRYIADVAAPAAFDLATVLKFFPRENTVPQQS